MTITVLTEIVLAEIPFHAPGLYVKDNLDTLELQKTEALKSLPVQWAVRNQCKVEQTMVFDKVTGNGIIAYYARLTPKQQTEFALRF